MDRNDPPPDQPTPLARVLATLAAELDQHATRPGPHNTTWQPCITQGHLDTLLPTAIGNQLPRVPYKDRAGFSSTVRATLPPVTGTVAEYAALLRQAAENM